MEAYEGTPFPRESLRRVQIPLTAEADQCIRVPDGDLSTGSIRLPDADPRPQRSQHPNTSETQHTSTQETPTLAGVALTG